MCEGRGFLRTPHRIGFGVVSISSSESKTESHPSGSSWRTQPLPCWRVVSRTSNKSTTPCGSLLPGAATALEAPQIFHDKLGPGQAPRRYTSRREGEEEIFLHRAIDRQETFTRGW